MLFDKPFEFDRFVRLLIGIAITIGVYWMLKELSVVLLPFLLAWLTAYLFEPVVAFTQRLIKSRVPSVLLTLLVITGMLVGIIVLVVPLILDEFIALEGLIAAQLNSLHWPAWLPESLATEIERLVSDLKIKELVQQDAIQERALGFLNGAMDVLTGVFGVLGTLFGIFTYILYLIFIMIDYEKLSTRWQKLIPEKYLPFLNTLLNDLEDGMNGYFKAQSKIVLICTILFALGFKLVGLPFGILLGILAGLLNFIPYAQLFSLIPALALTGLHSLQTNESFWWLLMWVLIVYVVIQALQDLYLTPKFMGEFSGFNPAIILLSLSIWGTLLGMVGLIIAIPLTSLLIHYYRRFIIEKVPIEIPDQDDAK